MNAVMDLDLTLSDVEIDYTAFAPDPDTGDGWTFEIHKVSYSLKRYLHPPIEIGDWVGHYFEEEILAHLRWVHEDDSL